MLNSQHGESELAMFLETGHVHSVTVVSTSTYDSPVDNVEWQLRRVRRKAW